jgi:hypothetical protein
MAVLEYGKYVLISRPQFNARLNAWFTYASAMWMTQDGTFQYHQFDSRNHTFPTQDAALTFGFTVARRWADAHFEIG